MKVLDYGAERKWQGLSALSVPLLPKLRIVADQVILAFRQREQGIPLRSREDQATRHVSIVRA